MFNRDGLFGGKDQGPVKDARRLVAAPGQAAAAAAPRPGQPEPPKAEPVAAPVPARTTESKASRLIVGPDIKLKGAEITDCDTLVVEGRVEASMDSRVMQIAEQGVFSGSAGIDIAEIHGRFEGELTARRQLIIHATGRVSGKIRYGKLSIAEGGELTGDIGALDAAAPRREPVARTAAGPVAAG